MDDDNEDRKRIVKNAEDLVKDADPNTVAAIALVMFYKAIAKAVATEELPPYSLTEDGLNYVFRHTMFGSEHMAGAAKHFGLPILDRNTATTAPTKKVDMN